MIRFEKKTAVASLSPEIEKNRFDDIREAAVEGHKKSAADGARRRSLPAREEDRLIWDYSASALEAGGIHA